MRASYSKFAVAVRERMDNTSVNSVRTERTDRSEAQTNKSSIYQRTDSSREASVEGIGLDHARRERLPFNMDEVDYSHDAISRTNTLDRSAEWVLNHHAPSLIVKLQKPVNTSFFSSLTKRNKTVDTEKRKQADEEDERYRISFSVLQNMHLRKLQCKIVKRVLDLRINKQDAEGEGEWEDLLKQYSMYYQKYEIC